MSTTQPSRTKFLRKAHSPNRMSLIPTRQQLKGRLMTLQSEQTPFDREIVEEVVSLTPESWGRIVLDVEYSNDEDGEGFAHDIYSPDGHRDIVIRGVV